MIFGSFGLLIVALALLIGAVVKSSVAIGVASLVCTAAAVGCLAAANALYRKQHGPAVTAATPAGAGGAPAAAVMVVPQMAMAGGYTNGYAPAPQAGPPVENFDALNAAQAAASVALLNLDQLHALRRHEVEHAARKTVLGAIDERITALVDLRRSLNG